MSEDVLEIVIQVAVMLYVAVRIVKSAWIRYKARQRTSDLAMYAIVEAEKQKWKEDIEDIAEEADS